MIQGQEWRTGSQSLLTFLGLSRRKLEQRPTDVNAHRKEHQRKLRTGLERGGESRFSSLFCTNFAYVALRLEKKSASFLKFLFVLGNKDAISKFHFMWLFSAVICV